MPNSLNVLSAKPRLSKLLVWFSLCGAVLISALSLFTYYSTNQLIQITQQRKDIALAKGLALAIGDLIVTHEYAQIENGLWQIMLNKNMHSIVVTDLNGGVLAYLERKKDSGPVTSNFSISSIVPPKTPNVSFLIENNEDQLQLWYKVDPGIPLGWIRFEIFANRSDSLMSHFQINVLLSLFIFFLSLLGAGVMLFYQAKHKNDERERRLTTSNLMLHNAARLDPLTKLPNRLALDTLVEKAMAVSRKDSDLLAICLMDLDGFKGVNDRMGHLSGDNLLVAVAGRMRNAVRESDSIVRLGGDEFVLILGGVQDKTQLNFLLRRILNLLSSPFRIDDQVISISASIGVTLYPNDDLPIVDLLAHADIAMYQSKVQGKNRWSLFDTFDSKAGEQSSHA